MTFLVEANWGRGRLLREYTVLLDPPTFMPSQPEQQTPVMSPQSGAQTAGRIERAPEPAPAEQRPVPAPDTTAREPAAPTRELAVPASLGGSYTVERNDTLWQIASSARPSASRRVMNQTMIALFRANPGAFDGNINRLRAGSVLRIPNEAEIEAISIAEASSEVSRQQQEWSSASRTAAGDDTSRLRLVPPEETPPAPAPQVEAPGASTQAGSASTPAASGTDDRRLEVTNPDLARAQQQASDAPVTPEPTTEPIAEPQPQAETPPVQAETPPAAQAPAAQPARPTPAAAPQPEGPSLLDRLIAFWWIPVLLGLVVIGALAFLRRRRDQSELSDLPVAGSDDFAFEPRNDRATKTRDHVDAFALDDEPADEPAPAFIAPAATRRTDSLAPRPVEPFEIESSLAEAKTADDTLSSESAVRFDQQDALAEADFHMAYGLYDQAADLVKIAIDREPARRDLKLKLLEIYFVWGNKDLFLDTARELNATRDAAPGGEWDKVLIMGKQIAPDDPMFQGGSGGHVDLVDVNLEGGENRVDLDLFAEPDEDAKKPAGLDLQFTTGEHRARNEDDDSDLDFLLDDEKLTRDDEPTREMDPLARTQETPTIESPMIDRTATTLREKVDKAAFSKQGTEQTAELSLDDLGLDVDALEATGSLEDTTALQEADDDSNPPLRDDEMTQLAPSLGSRDRTLEAPRVEAFDIESTGTIYVDQVDLSGGDTVEQRRPDVDSTAALQRPTDVDLDLGDFGSDATLENSETMRQGSGGEVDSVRFSDDVFGSEKTASFPKIDLDVGEPLAVEDREPTNKVITTEMELSELEPVTMSEVGTKLDLARAYMDMGDPDGARSILEEVVQEGNSSQKQEAVRLLDSIR